MAITNTVNESHLAGWEWGEYDGILRWGTNVVSDMWNDLYLRMSFDSDGGFFEGIASSGDSSGAVFVKGDDGVWRFDAVISFVGSSHAYMDYRGIGVVGCDQPIAPVSTYATRLYLNLSTISQILNTP